MRRMGIGITPLFSQQDARTSWFSDIWALHRWHVYCNFHVLTYLLFMNYILLYRVFVKVVACGLQCMCYSHKCTVTFWEHLTTIRLRISIPVMHAGTPKCFWGYSLDTHTGIVCIHNYSITTYCNPQATTFTYVFWFRAMLNLYHYMYLTNLNWSASQCCCQETDPFFQQSTQNVTIHIPTTKQAI